MGDDSPDFIKYVEPDPVPEEPARELVRIVEENDPMKPWTLVARCETDMEHHELRVNVLKPLVLEGVLLPDADGDIRVHKKHRLEDLVS